MTDSRVEVVLATPRFEDKPQPNAVRVDDVDGCLHGIASLRCVELRGETVAYHFSTFPVPEPHGRPAGSQTEYFSIITLDADAATVKALKPFAGEGGDAWIRRAFTATGPAMLKRSRIPVTPAVIKWRVGQVATPGSDRLSGTLAGPGRVDFNGMRFRSLTETRIAQALDEANVLYFPLTIGVRHRVKFKVDFLIVHRGRVGVLEVDGPTHTPTTRAREDSRAAWFEKSGIVLFRHYSVSAVDDSAAAVVADFVNDLRGPRF